MGAPVRHCRLTCRLGICGLTALHRRPKHFPYHLLPRNTILCFMLWQSS